jgi:hypothetical protein
MVDRKILRLIGLGLSTVTALVILIAASLVARSPAVDNVPAFHTAAR